MNVWTLALGALVSCGKNKTEEVEVWAPDYACPGGPGCESLGDGVLHAGVGETDVTPPCFEGWSDLDGDWQYKVSRDEYYDCGCDRLCADDEGYPGPDDGEGDGEFQAVWMAGFQVARAANGVHDPLTARAIALRQGDLTMAIVSVDAIGIFYDEVLTIRQDAADAGLDLDNILVTSTHGHEGPDTMGLWGDRTGASGVDADYMTFLRSQVLESIKQAVADLQPVTLRSNAVDISTYSDKGTWNFFNDHRDPKILDEMMYVAQFDAADGTSVATLVNWANHPETVSDENFLITADFPDAMRKTIESGWTWDSYSVPGIGGKAIYIQGTVGGMMTSLGTETTDPDGNSFSESSFEKSDAIGAQLGEIALDAVAGAQVVDSPVLEVRGTVIEMPIDNPAFQAMFLVGVIEREAYNYDPEEDLTDWNIPWLRSEIEFVKLGNISMVTSPGEMLPELAIGGYDGSRLNTTYSEFIDEGNTLPPAIENAPPGPYLKDEMPSEYNWVIGLGNDEIGYIIPEYNFVVHDLAPYLIEPEGDHYEETNSLGPQTAGIVVDAATQLIQWQP